MPFRAIAAIRLAVALCVCLAGAGCGTPQFSFAAPPLRHSSTYLVHLPGIAGEQYLDREMLRGLRAGGFDGAMEIHDWTAGDPGISALLARQRNGREAQAVADKIEARARAAPGGRIVVTGHSGGVGVLVWALEKLPHGIKIDAVLMLGPALSPTYDLTEALSHVTGKLYVFSSAGDVIVLGLGTKMFGTIDGVKCEAAGRHGFRRPPSADARAYEKVVPMPYQAKWMNDGNIGDHIGSMGKRFSKNVLAPLVRHPSGQPGAARPTDDEADQPLPGVPRMQDVPPEAKAPGGAAEALTLEATSDDL